MKILLAQNAHYYPALGGANRSNRTLLENLKGLGNNCLVVATMPKNPTPFEVLNEVPNEDPNEVSNQVNPIFINEDVAIYEYKGIQVHAVKTSATLDSVKLKQHLIEQIKEFDPDYIFVSTEDVGQILLEAAVNTAAKKVIYLARTTLYLPVGPQCYLEIPSKAKLLKKVGGIICVGDYVKDYLKKYADVDSVVLPISVFGQGPFPKYCNYEDGYILMVNPCAYKGISIFMELAKQFPREKFAAIPTWGTTNQDIENMKNIDNITIFEPFENMDDIFCKTKIVIVPSLWAEAKSRTIIEGMLRGIPVIASDVGGNREAKLGVDYTLPVNPIKQYNEVCDEKSLPVTEVEKQDLKPWFAAMEKLTTDKKNYEKISEASRNAALTYVNQRGGCEKVNEYLEMLLKKREEFGEAEEVEENPENKIANRLTDKKRTLLALKMKKQHQSEKINTYAPLIKIDRERKTEFISSYSQKRFWFLDQWNSNKATNHTHLVTRFTGKLNLEVLQRAINEIVKRHEVLRMVYKCMDDEIYCVPAQNAKCTLEISKIKAFGKENLEKRLYEQIQEVLCRPFDLQNEIPIRVVVLNTKKNENHFIVVIHHIASDMWSLRLLKKEIQTIYNAFMDGKDYELPNDEIQYLDFAQWQRNKLENSDNNEDVNYWKEALKGVPPYIRLTSDFKRPEIQTYSGDAYKFYFPKELMDEVGELSTKEQVTPFIITLAAFGVLLLKYSNMDDFVIGSPIAGRTMKETENIIGLFINTLSLRMNLSENPTVHDLLQQLKNVVGGAMAHQEYPFEKLVKELGTPQNLSYTPIFQVMFNFQSMQKEKLELKGIQGYSTLPINNTTKFDLNFAVKYMFDEVIGQLTYNTDLYKKETIVRMSEQYIKLLDTMVKSISTRISDLDVTLEKEKKQLLNEWSYSETAEYENIPYMHQLFERMVKVCPDDTAAVYDGASYTYRQLNSKANQFARYLRDNGVNVERPVGLFLERSLDLMVGMLGILKAGGAYVPFDPIYPFERIMYIAKDANIDLIITQKHLRSTLELPGIKSILIDDVKAYADYEDTDFDCGIKPENLFYILYTSGSTGKPKGVAIEHRNYTNYYFGVTKRMELEPKLRYAIASTFAADLATINVWAALSTGGQIHILSQDLAVDPQRYAKYFRDNRIDVIKMVPSHFKSLAQMANIYDVTPNRLLILAGEASYWDMITKIRREKPGTKIQIHYGPTETTVSMLTYAVTEERPEQHTMTLPLGRPLPNVLIYVLDEKQRPVPIGVAGELYIGGPGLARGYYHREDLTAERFIKDPFSNNDEDRLYKTGDSVRFIENGLIEFLGRIDEQVKVNGFRIELGEINTEILAYPEVTDVYAMVREDVPEQKILVAYVVTNNSEISISGLRNSLSDKLPYYMIPSAFVIMDKIPLNPNGKVNKFMFPVPENIVMSCEAEYEAPETDEEIALVTVWQEVLALEKIGINDNFFGLGGDSFKAVQVTRQFDGRLGIMDIFRYSTIKELAPHLLMGHSGYSELLYQMTMHDDKEENTTIVCIPFAGGSAIAYKELAEKLSENISLYAVQIPGHDFSQQNEELMPIKDVALAVIKEIKQKVVSKKIAVYGHCLGGALGIEIAKLIEKEDFELVGVFMGGNFPASELPGKFFKMWNKLFPRDKRMSNRSYMDMLRSLGGFSEELSKDETDFIIKSLRHDRRESEKYYCGCYEEEVHEKISVPIKCIVGELDRTAEFYTEQYSDWEFFSDYVDYEVIPNAGHYFFKHQAAMLTDIIEDTIENWENKEYITEKAKADESVKEMKNEPKPSLKTLAIFVLGQLISLMGSSLMSFSIGIWMYQETGSAMLFAATLIFSRLPGIFVLPFSGTLADRFDRRKILIISNACSAIVTLTLATMVATGTVTTTMIYLAVSLLSITNAFQRPAYLAAVAQITPKRFLGQANGMVQLATSSSDILAPALGGYLIIVLDLSNIIYLNLASFVLCIITLLIIRFPNTLYHMDEETFLQQMAGGWKFIVKRKSFIALVVYFAIANLMLGIANVLVTPLAYTLYVNDYTVVIGLVTSATGLGGLIGGILMSLWGGTKRRAEGMIGFGFLLGIGYIIMGSRPITAILIIGVFIYGISMSLVNAHWQTLIQSKVRAELLARVFAINQLFVLPTIPLGYFIGGKLSENIFKPLFANNGKAVETFGWIVGTGEARGIALLFILIGISTTIWSFLCFHYKPLRYMDEILPDAVPGAVFIKDRNQLQREEDYQLEMIKARERNLTRKIREERIDDGKIQCNDSLKQRLF